MLVDKTEFEAWMERIMGELYRNLPEAGQGGNKGKTPELPERRASVRQSGSMPRCCVSAKRTLQRYRNNGVLKFYSIYHKTYYKESDLHEFIRNNFDENEIKRQAREDKLSESYPLPEE